MAALPLLARSMSTVLFHMIMLLSIVIAPGVTTSTDLVLESSLSSALWESSSDLLAEAWNTTFIKGVRYGNLDPNFYGAYTMQDAAWCREIAKVWEQVVRNESAPQELRHYANQSQYGYLKASEDLFKSFTLEDNGKDNNGVILGLAAKQYIKTVQTATIKYGAPYIMIATYPCVKLWANITADLNSIVNSSNPYSIWVYQNLGDDTQASKIDEWAHWYDLRLSISIFRQAMYGEINLFNLKN